MKISRKKMMEYLVVILLVYAASLAYLYYNQRNMIYFPDTSVPDLVPGIEAVEVETVDGLKLRGWWFPPTNPKLPLVVHFQGNAGNHFHRGWKAELLNKNGYGVLLATYRGYGGNPGTMSEQGLLDDGRAWMNFLRTQGKPIVVFGESLGTGVAVRMAGEFDAAGLILESPYSSIADVAQSLYPIVPVKILLRDRFDSMANIGAVKAPKLFVHGVLDRTIPIKFGRRLFDAADEPKSFIALDSAGHNDLYDHDAALHILDFLSTIPGSE
jgi:fermentation-respiration switch protein FrsA (DUF1100 family)